MSLSVPGSFYQHVASACMYSPTHSSPLLILICTNTRPAPQWGPKFSSNTTVLCLDWNEPEAIFLTFLSADFIIYLSGTLWIDKSGWNFWLLCGVWCLSLYTQWKILIISIWCCLFTMARSTVLSDCDRVVTLVFRFYMHPTQPHLMVFSTSSLKDVPSLHSKVYFLRFILWLAQHEPVSQVPLHSTQDTMRVVWQMA